MIRASLFFCNFIRLSIVLWLASSIFLVSVVNAAAMIVAPGSSPRLQSELIAAYESLGADYVPRTEHIDANGKPVYLNRLIREDSPYLLQHAHNPVNWYPWGEEAFAIAKAENKPVFLSIGYATCHWCHVMERESFENEAIAELLNEHFIAIKVDREQRPDVDSTYMTAVQMLTGSGGWPMSSFLNAKGQPFYGGTYYTPDAFSNLLGRVNSAWTDSPDRINEEAQKVSRALDEVTRLSKSARDVGADDIHRAKNELADLHDELQGGFGQAPKFPRESALLFLLDLAKREHNTEVLSMANFTLQQIAAGGIHDQVGGGFHRYAVDPAWLVPHFEKMLYNQAGLSRTYTEAWKLTGDKEHARTVRRLNDYVLREMTATDGVFYSATDADSGGGEGLFFIWTPEELREVLSEEDAEFALKVWNLTERGNFEHRNILHLEGSLTEIAANMDLSQEEFTRRLNQISDVLLIKRQEREAPLLDNKIITAWNGLMITAMAEAGEALQEPKYISAAQQAADVLWSSALLKDDSLRRVRLNNRWSITATQTDYAYLAEAYITLFDVTGERRYLNYAEKLVAKMNEKFWDKQDGAYFMGAAEVAGSALPSRPKDLYDSALPSGNSVAARVLVRLWRRTGNEEYYDKALALFGAFSDIVSRSASSVTYLMTALGEFRFSEAGELQYAGRGHVRVRGLIEGAELKVQFEIADGWHINAEAPLQDYLIGTELRRSDGEALAQVVYPEAKRVVLGFQRSELALYDGQFEITAPASEDMTILDGAIVSVVVNLQACNDQICLAPESITLNIATN
ncbi:MAG: DUF255 domain-containing protein [Granulosicoccus sp.]|nr:DUF255 domain-containing protein [Granulosicoccus sp.]